MKQVNPFFIYAYITVVLTLAILACSKSATNTGDLPSNTGDTLTSKLFERLQFSGSLKKDGKIPGGPTGSSLKKSFKDTLYLVDQVKIPIEFLHKDTLRNIAGIYIGFSGGSFYYAVPEIKETEVTDTVSVILMGFNPKDLPLPLSFNITMTPYNKNGDPIDQFTVPVKINPSNDDPGKQGICGLDLPPGDYWNWSMSYVLDENAPTGYSFMNFPKKIHGAGGQFIKGCCKDGASYYNINCSGDVLNQRTLLFPTFFQYPEESFNFSNDGSYDRTTIEEHATPDPPASNFCGTGKGVVNFKSTIVVYVGKWTIKPSNVPADLHFYYTTRNYLTLQTTSSSGGGYGNPGGIIHYLDCRNLMLILPDREGGGRHLYKIYKRKMNNSPDWFKLT